MTGRNTLMIPELMEWHRDAYVKHGHWNRVSFSWEMASPWGIDMMIHTTTEMDVCLHVCMPTRRGHYLPTHYLHIKNDRIIWARCDTLGCFLNYTENFICIYVCILCVHVYVGACIYCSCVYMCIWVCMYIYVCVHISVCMYMCIYCVVWCVYVYVCIYVYIGIYVFMCVCACMCVHACVWVQRSYILLELVMGHQYGWRELVWGFPARAECALNHRAASPAPGLLI